jgi:hypothetical protein
MKKQETLKIPKQYNNKEMMIQKNIQITKQIRPNEIEKKTSDIVDV